MFTEELKRVLFHYKGILLILIFGILYVGSVMNTRGWSFEELGQGDKAFDRECFEEWSGFVDDVKYEQFKNEYNELVENTKQDTDYYNELSKGEITFSEYKRKSSESNKRMEIVKIYHELYSAIEYAYKKNSDRQVLYYIGWRNLFAYGNYMFLTIPLVVIYVFLFCMDGKKFVPIQAITYRGRKNIVLSRICGCIAVTVAYISLLELIVYILINLRTGLPHSEYYIQSLYYLLSYDGKLTMLQAFELKILMEILGALLIGAVVIVFSILKNMYGAILLGGMLATESLFIPKYISGGLNLLRGSFSITIALDNDNVVQIITMELIIIICVFAFYLYKNPEKRIKEV